MHVDGIRKCTVSREGVDAGEYNVIEVLMTDSELAELQKLYDPRSSRSPSSDSCREVVRVILDALARRQE